MKKLFYSILILVLAGIVLYVLVNNKKPETTIEPDNISQTEIEYVTYKTPEQDIEFTYPKIWGEVTQKEGNTTCPEEDTYRTPDTLHIFDKEYSFSEMKLPGSESMIRTGIRTYTLDPKQLNNCGDSFHLKIAQKEVVPESLSSFKLNSIKTSSGLEGTYNAEASRLNTEARMQYTFYIMQPTDIYIIQPYMSFTPVFGSPELQELDTDFKGNMTDYLEQGKTAQNIRTLRTEFKKLVENMYYLK